jgi:hypothetical protein
MVKAVAPGVGAYFGRHGRTQTDFDAKPETIREVAQRLDECTTRGFDLIWQWAPNLRGEDSSTYSGS